GRRRCAPSRTRSSGSRTSGYRACEPRERCQLRARIIAATPPISRCGLLDGGNGWANARNVVMTVRTRDCRRRKAVQCHAAGVAVAIRSDVVRVWTFRCWRSKSPTFLRCFYGAPRGVARHACCEVGMKNKKAIARVGLDSTLASLLVWATVADAQTPAEGRAKTAILDPIVVTASRTPQSITQLLADVTVIG